MGEGVGQGLWLRAMQLCNKLMDTIQVGVVWVRAWEWVTGVRGFRRGIGFCSWGTQLSTKLMDTIEMDTTPQHQNRVQRSTTTNPHSPHFSICLRR